MDLELEYGRVSKRIDASELVVRQIACKEEGSDDSGFEYHLQGHLVNKTGSRVSSLNYDVSYYSADGKFIGLTKSTFLDDDELEPEESLAIDMELSIPESAKRLVFNCRGSRPGWLMSMVWG